MSDANDTLYQKKSLSNSYPFTKNMIDINLKLTILFNLKLDITRKTYLI